MVVADSYEKGGQNFTDTFLTDFRERYGYDALPFLPVYDGVVAAARISPTGSCGTCGAWRRQAGLCAYRGGCAEIAHKYGADVVAGRTTATGGYPGEFLQYGGQSDEVGGEFWGEGSLGDIENRAASSCAHIYGKRKVSAESYTSAGNDFGRIRRW